MTVLQILPLTLLASSLAAAAPPAPIALHPDNPHDFVPPGLSWVEIQATAVEKDGRLEVFSVSVAPDDRRQERKTQLRHEYATMRDRVPELRTAIWKPGLFGKAGLLFRYLVSTSSRFISSLVSMVQAASAAGGSDGSGFDSPTANSSAASSAWAA